MFCCGFTKDQDVIQEHSHKVIQHVHEYIIHQLLESGRTVGQSKWHDSILVGSIPSPECSVFLRVRMHADVVEALPDVQLCEHFCLGDVSHNLIN